MSNPGHVFVVRGDATRFACDWRLIPSGTRSGVPGDIGKHWRTEPEIESALASAGWDKRAPSAHNRAVVLCDPTPAPTGSPGIVVVHTGDTGDEHDSWFAAALHDAARLVQRRKKRHLPLRPRPLIVSPMLGTGRGGADQRRTGVLRSLLSTAADVARQGFDVALVVHDAQTFSAAQRLRIDRTWPLTAPQRRAARALAAKAREGQLVPFIGAGVSAGAGLPGWNELLEQLAQRAKLTKTQRGQLGKLDPRDAALVLERRLGDIDATLGELFATATRPALQHYLLASLPVREAVTTNYDCLFETAWQQAGDEDVAVLPRELGTDARRWLLKLHGDLAEAPPKRRLVLSRDEYLRFERHGGAIAGVLQAMLMTRHLFVVGYGLTDETFHRIAYDVRDVRRSAVQQALRDTRVDGRIGTAALVTPPDLGKEVWAEDLDLLSFAGRGENVADAAWRLEVFLDYLCHEAAPVESYILGDGWHHLSLEGPDLELRRALEAIQDIRGLPKALQRELDVFLTRFGALARSPSDPPAGARPSA